MVCQKPPDVNWFFGGPINFESQIIDHLDVREVPLAENKLLKSKWHMFQMIQQGASFGWNYLKATDQRGAGVWLRIQFMVQLKKI